MEKLCLESAGRGNAGSGAGELPCGEGACISNDPIRHLIVGPWWHEQKLHYIIVDAVLDAGPRSCFGQAALHKVEKHQHCQDTFSTSLAWDKKFVE